MVMKHKKTKHIELVKSGSPMSISSILLGLLLLVLLSALFVIGRVFESTLTIIFLSIIPVFIFLFVLKLFAWSYGGKEHIEITKNALKTKIIYPFLFKSWEKTYAFQRPSFSFLTLTQGTLNHESFSVFSEKHPKSKAKLHVLCDNDQAFTSSFSFEASELEKVVSLYNNL